MRPGPSLDGESITRDVGDRRVCALWKYGLLCRQSGTNRSPIGFPREQGVTGKWAQSAFVVSALRQTLMDQRPA